MHPYPLVTQPVRKFAQSPSYVALVLSLHNLALQGPYVVDPQHFPSVPPTKFWHSVTVP